MYVGRNVIKSLTSTPTKKHGPYGDEQGPSFSNKMNEGKIVGFHGSEGLFLDAVGVHVMEAKIPPPKPPLSKAIIQSEKSIAEIDNSPWSNKLVLANTTGTRSLGRRWRKTMDDGVYSGIRQIYITKSEAICSMQIEYDRNGQSVWSTKHGGHKRTTTNRVKLDFPNEVVNCVSGYYGCIDSEEKRKVVTSLTLYTSRGKYGPFGEEKGTFCTSTVTEGKEVGFHGRSSAYLDVIVHMQHWLGNQRTTRLSLFKYFT
ncbi:Jacalin-related lectin 3 [Hibiscus syriacus]|uniref:Jacalin-related lectin 3 n=1 Tax=Hibiscus syriacus TaxID=106335 RepID=A0A6A2YHD4_HIBSY|nr:Jacalin-related lectin 3 [Hibiscus syriacus]